VFQRFYPYKQRLENNLINAFAAEGEFDSKIYLALPLLVYNAILPLLAEDLLKKYPLIRLNVTCLNKPNLTLDEVGKFDLCFSEKISAANKFSLNRIGEFYSQLYCGEKYAQEFGVPQSLAELEKDHAKHLAVLTKRRLGFTRFSDGELFLCDVTPRIIAPMNFLSYIQDSNLLVESHYHGVAKQDSRIIKVLPDYYLLHGEFYLIKNLQRRTKVVDLVESKILEYIASEMSKYTGDFL
jgi:hypothetical protein